MQCQYEIIIYYSFISQALRKDRKGMFRFNPGREQSTVPAYNPYTISKCRGCDIPKGRESLARDVPPDNQVCAACRYIHSLEKEPDYNMSLRDKAKEAQKSLVNWYKENLPSVKVGKFDAKRFEISTNDNKEVFINKKFYEETKNKYQKDPLYSLKLEYAKLAHELLPKASYIRPEDSKDHPGERFEVYEYVDSCFRVEMKVRCNADGIYLHVLRIYPK